MIWINRAFICILLLSISGFVSSSIYLVLEKKLYQWTSAKFMVFVNTVVLFSFVIPFYYLISIMDGSESNFVNYNVVVFEGKNAYHHMIVYTRDVFSYIKYIDNIWFMGVLFFIVMKIFLYLCTIMQIKRTSFMMQSDIWVSTFEKIRGNYTKQNVTLLESHEITNPFTVGILHKYIVIPSMMIDALDAEEIAFILCHECYHVSQNDMGRKFLIILLQCFHWFNPLFYLLKNNLSIWMEIACDEAVTENFDGRQKKKYAALIIQSLELQNMYNRNHLYCICYGDHNIKHYKRRILEIMGDKKKNGLYGKVFVSALAVCSLTFSNVVAKAADAPVNMMFSNNVSIENQTETEVVPTLINVQDMFLDVTFKTLEENFEEFVIDTSESVTYEIVDGDSEIENINADVALQHIHTTKDVVIKVHKKHTDGSCTTTYYEGKQCSKCGVTWKGDVINVVNMAKCMH